MPLASLDFQLGDNCIQNFHLGRYIIRYRVRNLVLRQNMSGAIKRDLQPYIRQMNILNMVIFILMHFWACLLLKFFFCLKLEHCKQHEGPCHPKKCDVINYIKL